jgi:hypothetical protein
MSKRPSLEDLARAATSQRDNANTSLRDNVTTLPTRLTRVTPPHMSLYVSKRVRRTIKEIALEYDCKPHDILVEGVELVLAKYGRPGVRALSEN